MPDTITHILFAENVLKYIDQKLDEKAYYLGSIGPDPLYYYNILSFKKKKNSVKIAGKIHKSSGYTFLNIGKKYVKNQTDRSVRHILYSYLYGFFSHYILDSTAHPYINRVSKGYANGHKRFEMNIDTLLLRAVKNKSSKKFDFKYYLKLDKKREKLISDMFNYIVRESYSDTFDCDIYVKGVKHMLMVCDLFKDPFKIFKCMSKIIETLIRKKGALNYLFYSKPGKNEPDYMNLEKKLYKNSFNEVFDTAIERFTAANEDPDNMKYFMLDFGGNKIKSI